MKLVLILCLAIAACAAQPPDPPQATAVTHLDEPMPDMTGATGISPSCDEAKPAHDALTALIGPSANMFCITIVGKWTCCQEGRTECCCYFWNCRCQEP